MRASSSVPLHCPQKTAASRVHAFPLPERRALPVLEEDLKTPIRKKLNLVNQKKLFSRSRNEAATG
jgi:hypothetical protein